MTRLLLLIATVWMTVLPAAAAAQDPHAGHTPPAAQKPAPKGGQEDHSAHAAAGEQQPKEPLPPLTDADRAAAFPPDMHGHETHDQRINSFVLFDRMEWRGRNDDGWLLENTSWIGGDVQRLWLRAEVETDRGDLEHADLHVMYGRSLSRWWDVVAGVRQDFDPGPAQTWLAVGLQGLSPQWFEVQATGYVGAGGRTQLRVEAEYELLLTQRLVLQPLVEADIYGKDDAARGVGAGLSSLEAGLRIRYEVRREFAPYLGVTWERTLFGTADLARARGDAAGRARLAVGVRTWF